LQSSVSGVLYSLWLILVMVAWIAARVGWDNTAKHLSTMVDLSTGLGIVKALCCIHKLGLLHSGEDHHVVRIPHHFQVEGCLVDPDTACWLCDTDHCMVIADFGLV
jgi:hypothetical protein